MECYLNFLILTKNLCLDYLIFFSRIRNILSPGKIQECYLFLSLVEQALDQYLLSLIFANFLKRLFIEDFNISLKRGMLFLGINLALAVDVRPLIVNFVSFLISSKKLLFSNDPIDFEISGVTVPQGGVLSPLLLNLTLSNADTCIPHEVKWLMFADGLIIYIKSKSAV